MENLTSYLPWIITGVSVLVFILLWKYIFRLFLGGIIVPENKSGIVTKTFKLFGTNRQLPEGRVIATKGEAGIQAGMLSPGVHFWLWPWQYKIQLVDWVTVPAGKIGIVKARDGRQNKDGYFLARTLNQNGQEVLCDDFQDSIAFIENGGQIGVQTKYLLPKSYRINTALFQVDVVDMTQIPEGKVGIVTTKDGLPIPQGEIAGEILDGHMNFQNVDKFLEMNGKRGLQEQVLQAGTWMIHPYFASIEIVNMTEVPVGNVGVVVSFVGSVGTDTTGEEFKHGNIVTKGSKGVWKETLDPGKYAINIKIMNVVLVPTTNIVLNWANARTESHNLDKNLSTITVRSMDGFEFNLDVSQIINISNTTASKVIARFGTVQNLVSQVLEPTIGNYFRNSAQKSDAIEFLKSRSERQSEARGHINEVLEKYDVVGVDTLIGDINPPSALMKTLTDRKIAEQERITFSTQKDAQDIRKQYESSKANADIQVRVVEAERGVDIAEKVANAKVMTARGDADSKTINAKADAEVRTTVAEADAKSKLMVGNATAEVTLKTGNAEAEVAKQKVNAMGESNYADVLKVQYMAEAIKTSGVPVVPQIVVGGNGNDATGNLVSAFVGAKILEQGIEESKKPTPHTPTTGKV